MTTSQVLEFSFAFTGLEVKARIYLDSLRLQKWSYFFRKPETLVEEEEWVGRECMVSAHEACDSCVSSNFHLTSGQTSVSWDNYRWTWLFSITQVDCQSQNKKTDNKTNKQTTKTRTHTHATPLYSISFTCEERLKLKCLALLKTEKRKIPGIGLVLLHHSAAGIYQLILHHLKQLICFPSLIIL